MISREIVRNLIDRLRNERDDDGKRTAELLSILYEELHTLAKQLMRYQPPGHTLQTTALVNEAALRLLGDDVKWEDRSHFLRTAAQAMRCVLVDHARSQQTTKRGAGWRKLPLDTSILNPGKPSLDILLLDDALARLATKDLRMSKIVELRFFGGLTEGEVARVLGVSRSTVTREWLMAKAWLMNQVG